MTRDKKAVETICAENSQVRRRAEYKMLHGPKTQDQNEGKHPEFGWLYEWLEFRVKERTLIR